MFTTPHQFAEDELFTLVAFDCISMRNMYIQNSIRCQRFPGMYEGFEAVGLEQLGSALLENERTRQGCLPRRKKSDPVANSFLRTAELATGSVWGSNVERSQWRRKAFAYQTRFGQPALFVTLTPNTDSSFATAQYTGISSVKTLFDIFEARVPSKSELREASLGNDCASARLFIRQVDAFIECVLGIDPTTKKQLPHDGLFGDVRAYFGMVETQGRGTLHIHFLIWLKGCPSNSAAVESILNSPDAAPFCASVEAYVHSIVRVELPVDLRGYRCTVCGASVDELAPLPIPDRARKDPLDGLYSARMKASVQEPALLCCRACNTKCSSQHVLRNLLLKHRPLSWPVWRYALSTSSILEQAQAEMACRDSERSATNAVDDRESTMSSMRDEYDLKTENGLTPMDTAALLDQANSTQMKFCKSDDDPFQNDCLTRLIEMLPPCLSDNRMEKQSMDYMVSALVLLLNQHWWGHTASCFKQSRATADASFCRYSFPRDRIEKTIFNSAGVELKRPIAHEFINGYNYAIMATFKCNHDIQLLLGGRDATERIHYCCKYVTKQQKQLDSTIAIALASLKRRQEKEKVEMESLPVFGAQESLSFARKRVASLAYGMTSRQEVAGPLAALYLSRGSCCYCSERCVSIPLGDVVQQLKKTDGYTCYLVSEDDKVASSKFHAVSYLDDYIYRPEELKRINLYEFAMHYFRKRDPRGLEAPLSFLCGHPLSQNHSIGQRHGDVVPVIHGYRLPYIDVESTRELQAKRALLSLALFKPFRSLIDLINTQTWSDDAWIAAYDEWEPTRSQFVTTIMANMDDYYYGMNHAHMQRNTRTSVGAPTKQEKHFEEGSSSEEENDDLFDTTDTFLEDDCALDDPFVDIWEGDENTQNVLDSDSVNPAICPTTAAPDSDISHIMSAFSAFDLLEDAAKQSLALLERDHGPPFTFGAVSDMRKWVLDPNTDNALFAGPCTATAADTKDTEVIELLSKAILESVMAWTPVKPTRTKAVPEIRPFATIVDVSRAFTLNEKQHVAVTRIGLALLTRWKKAEALEYVGAGMNGALENDQLRLFLGGEGGTGKSRIIDAIQALCMSWGRSDSLIKTALTGKAATVIEGRTLASFLLQLRRDKSIDAVMNLSVIVIDEISMMKKEQLVELDELLRKVKRVPRVLFGGIHVILVGDFLQLPPVGADPIYADPKTKPKPLVTDIEGFQIWRSFVDVIVLDESVRFQGDPEWGLGCRQARLGVWTPEFVQIVNSRVVTRAGMTVNAAHGGTSPTFVTPDNTTRLAINNLYISKTCQRLPRGEFPVRVVANFRGKLSALNRTEVRMVMALPDSKFGRMAPYLDLIIGMPIQVTQNVRPEKMVANGTLGTLESIIYRPNTTFRLVRDCTCNIVVKIPSVSPLAVIVRLPRGNSATPMVGCTDNDLFPLWFESQAFRESKIRLIGTTYGHPRTLSVRIQQFPLVCAVASTIYKVQGETLDNMIVTEWRSKRTAANKRQQPYLLVSRVTSRFALLTLSPLTREIIQWAHPPNGALIEEQRLLALSEITLRELKCKR